MLIIESPNGNDRLNFDPELQQSTVAKIKLSLELLER